MRERTKSEIDRDIYINDLMGHIQRESSSLYLFDGEEVKSENFKETHLFFLEFHPSVLGIDGRQPGVASFPIRRSLKQDKCQERYIQVGDCSFFPAKTEEIANMVIENLNAMDDNDIRWQNPKTQWTS